MTLEEKANHWSVDSFYHIIGYIYCTLVTITISTEFEGHQLLLIMIHKKKGQLIISLSDKDRKKRTFASLETAGRVGNSTFLALIIVSSLSILSCDWSCPKGRLPNSIWYNKIPADQTST